jgi:hypothetical protein
MAHEKGSAFKKPKLEHLSLREFEKRPGTKPRLVDELSKY